MIRNCAARSVAGYWLKFGGLTRISAALSSFVHLGDVSLLSCHANTDKGAGASAFGYRSKRGPGSGLGASR
jgi:hypothetical protein